MEKTTASLTKGLTLLQEFDKNALSLVRTLGLLGRSLLGGRVELFCGEKTANAA